ncbi:15_t:CDS:2 [Acaulospora colombiana]|uniref:15_t:CDS:1 n=1 Tax=Acaulospora colombiana TaxID=27376 RepID=A0ACA9KHA3_9GLOM|nr:15_t:CDS:2 [Acaulospora colombiana]
MKPARKQVDDSIFKVGPTKADRPDAFYNIWYNKWSGGERTLKYSRQRRDADWILTPVRRRPTKCLTHTFVYISLADVVLLVTSVITGTEYHQNLIRWIRQSTCLGATSLMNIVKIWVASVRSTGKIERSMSDISTLVLTWRKSFANILANGEKSKKVVLLVCLLLVSQSLTISIYLLSVKILKDKGVAFVTYQCILNAEFAKEAMSNQSLDHNEVLNVRWATDDPNPRAKAEFKRKAEAIAAQAIQKSLPAEFTLVNDDYINKRPRMDDSFTQDQYGLEGYQNPQYIEQSIHHNKLVRQNAEASTSTKGASIDHKNAIISAETLENIKSISQNIYKSNTKTNTTQSNDSKALIQLADYGTDEEESDEEE